MSPTSTHFAKFMNTLRSRADLAGLICQAASLLVGWAILCSFSSRAANAQEFGKKFQSPEEAVAALQRATTAVDKLALRDILGPAAEDLQNPDLIQATNELKTFSTALAQTNRLIYVSKAFVILELGEDLWPFPVPIVKKDDGWIFDTAVGKDELHSRHVGKNELAILPVMRAYVDAQREYAASDHDGDEVLEYAQRLISSPLKEDGLYWPPGYVGDESPFGPLVAFAQEKGYSPELRDQDEAERGPFYGYYFKILTSQGKHARGGKYNYVINENMIAGFATIAWPAAYSESGIMTFIVNQQGRVYQKDLGRDTAKMAKKMEQYDPDPSWKISPD